MNCAPKMGRNIFPGWRKTIDVDFNRLDLAQNMLSRPMRRIKALSYVIIKKSSWFSLCELSFYKCCPRPRTLPIFELEQTCSPPDSVHNTYFQLEWKKMIVHNFHNQIHKHWSQFFATKFIDIWLLFHLQIHIHWSPSLIRSSINRVHQPHFWFDIIWCDFHIVWNPKFLQNIVHHISKLIHLHRI